jgi:hypothetical protein
MSPLNCDEFESLAAEFALGVLPGDQRGLALTHLAACPTCRAQTRELARIADSMLLLTQPAEPPSGFESRVLSRIGMEEPAIRKQSRKPSSRRVRLAAAAVVVALVGTAGLLTGRFTGGGNNRLAAGDLAVVWKGGGTCRVAAFPGHGGIPAMLVVRLDEPSERPGPYPVQLIPAKGGAPVPFGVIEVRNGQGILQSAIPASVGTVRGIRVFEGNDLRYTATFAPV